MELVFTKGIPNARIFVSHVTMGENTDYRLRRTHELISAPVAVRQNKIKDISVSFHSYKETPESVVVASEEITVPYDGYEHLVYFKILLTDFFYLPVATAGQETVPRYGLK